VLVQNRLVRLFLSIVGAVVLLRLRNPRAPRRDALRWLAKRYGGVGARSDFATGALVSLGNPSHFAFWLGVGSAVVAAGIADPTAVHFGVFFGGFMLACVLGASCSPPSCRWTPFLESTVLSMANLLCGASSPTSG